jgi:hypothetical protein
MDMAGHLDILVGTLSGHVDVRRNIHQEHGAESRILREGFS